MPNRQAQCQRAWRQSRQVATLLQDCSTGSSHYAGGILTLVLTSFNPPHLNFMVYWLILLRKSGQCGFTACPDGRLHHLGNSPAFRWAKVMGRLFPPAVIHVCVCNGTAATAFLRRRYIFSSASRLAESPMHIGYGAACPHARA